MTREFYEQKTANFPRLKTDVLFADYKNLYKYNGFVDNAFSFVLDKQLMRVDLWARFAEQFRSDSDYDAGWRCEYWGKMMRGACFVYSYTQNPELYKILSDTVEDIITAQDEKGRISSYSINHEFDGWDMWGRKYVLLGMQYFLEICSEDALKQKIITSMCRQVDYIINKVGDEDGKKPITKCTRHWRGLNSSSILEPVVRLYSLTEDKKYFDFAKYIVDCGATDVENIFKLAYENNMYPYQYPVTKAYEMMSCFEGLLEFYRITGEKWYKTAIINFADKILESDFTVIGTSGCTHELFDHSSVRQSNTTNGAIQQETCVTVTLMKFMYQLTLLTGDTKYVDAFEKSFYNAYLGSLNTENVIEPMIIRDHPEWAIEPLPFDSYSPLTSGTRGNGIGGLKVMSDNHYYGCCACIGSAGIGLVPKMQLMSKDDGFAVNLYINGSVKCYSPKGQQVVFGFDTKYPKSGNVEIEIGIDVPENFEILVRNPHWSKKTVVFVNNEPVDIKDGYISITKQWTDKDKINIDFDMRTQVIYPKAYGSQILMNKVVWGANIVVPTFDKEDPIAKNHVALQRGPLMLAQDSRLGYSVDDAVTMNLKDGYIDVEISDDTVGFDTIINAKVPLADGTYMTAIDYSSAGKLWTEQSKMAVWMLTE